MKTALVVGLPWLRSGTGRVMEMQIKHLRDLGFRTVFCAVPSSYTGGFSAGSWADFNRKSQTLGADEVLISGFSELGPLKRCSELARAWIKKHDAMHWALAPAHFAVPPPRIEEILRNEDVRLVLANHVYTLPFALKLKRGLAENERSIAFLAVTHDIQSQILLDRKATAPWSRTMASEAELLQTELSWLSMTDSLIHVSCDDLDFFRKHLPRMRHHLMLPAIEQLNLARFRQQQVPARELLYVGVDHVGNVESLRWYFSEVIPRFSGRIPRLTLVGQICRAASSFLPHNSKYDWLELAGEVEDISPYYSSCKVALGAVTSGRGISIKTIEAFAAGIPVVGTDMAFRGMPRADLFRCGISGQNDSYQFARRIEDILAGNGMERLQKSSQKIYNLLFTPEKSLTAFREILNSEGL